METDATPALPRIAADLPAATGKLKAEPEDFRVEEIPTFPPEGEGEHLYLWIEKRDISHERLIEQFGEGRGRAIQYAESFEGCEYGTPLTSENRYELFPFFE